VFFSMRLFVKVVMEFLNSRCESIMEFVCVFFFVSLVVIPFFLEYSRIDVFASLELLLTFCYSDWSTSLGFSLYTLECV